VAIDPPAPIVKASSAAQDLFGLGIKLIFFVTVSSCLFFKLNASLQ